MTVSIEEETGIPFSFDYRKTAEDTILAVLHKEALPEDFEVELLLTDGECIREMNREFRGIDRETDVLSFPMIDFQTPADIAAFRDDPSVRDPDTGLYTLGNIVLNIARVCSQAKDFGHSERREYAFLIAHSMLHLLGYDHEEEDERRVMEEKQEHIMEALGIFRD